MTDTVKLANGKTVSLDEFLTWSSIKQYANLNPSNLGRKFSPEMGNKIRESMRKYKEAGFIYNTVRGSEHYLARAVKTPIGVFDTLISAARALGVLGCTLRNWINQGKAGYEFLTPPKPRKPQRVKGGASNTRNGSARKIVTPAGEFPSIKAAAEFYSVSRSIMNNWIIKARCDDFKFDSGPKYKVNTYNFRRQKIRTPNGIFASVKEAAVSHNVTSEGIRYRVKKGWDQYEYIDD